MKTRKEANPALAVYLDNLLIQLRMRDVPGDKIGQILAEVESHVADTGQDPVDAFGEPGEYAETYAVAASVEHPAQGWWSDLGLVVVCALGGMAIGDGAFHLVGSVEVSARDLGVWLAAAAVALVLFRGVLGPLLEIDTAGSVKQRIFTSRFMLLGMLAWTAAVAVLVLIQWLLPTGPILVSAPGWVFLVAGLLVFFVAWRRFSDRVVDPRR